MSRFSGATMSLNCLLQLSVQYVLMVIYLRDILHSGMKFKVKFAVGSFPEKTKLTMTLQGLDESRSGKYKRRINL